jgi:carboxyl-terminal processing protease
MDRIPKVKEALLDLVLYPRKPESGESYLVDRSKAEWAKDEIECMRVWKNRLSEALLEQKAGEKPERYVARTYERERVQVAAMDDKVVQKLFLEALARAYDPHSDYLPPEETEDLNIAMSLAMVGIGVSLKVEDGYPVVSEIYKGGPVERAGVLRAGDRILAISPTGGAMEDLKDLPLDRVVEKIRGPKGTMVGIRYVRLSEGESASAKEVMYKREEIQLHEGEAVARIMDFPVLSGAPYRLGYIHLPSFYSRTAEDCEVLLRRLDKEHVSGILLDLRGNGGGSLDEVIKLAGMFLGPGPVVQVKDSLGGVSVSCARDVKYVCHSPLVILVNRLSASASEILAGALQDYQRAVVVGDGRTFGKGTVQTVVDISPYLPFPVLVPQSTGSLKLTTQKFYRVSGGSTQYRGVASDITLPSGTDIESIGECSMDFPLGYDEVPGIPLKPYGVSSKVTSELLARAKLRTSGDAELNFLTSDMKVFREWEKNPIAPVSKEERDQMLLGRQNALASRAEHRKHEFFLTPRVSLVKVGDLNVPQIVSGEVEDVPPGDRAVPLLPGWKMDEPPGDPIRREAFSILKDLCDLAPKSGYRAWELAGLHSTNSTNGPTQVLGTGTLIPPPLPKASPRL